MKDVDFGRAGAVRPVSPFLAAFIQMMVPGCPDGHKPERAAALSQTSPPPDLQAPVKVPNPWGMSGNLMIEPLPPKALLRT